MTRRWRAWLAALGLGCLSPAALAFDLFDLGELGQAEFQNLTEDIAAGTAYRSLSHPLSPRARPWRIGIDLGVSDIRDPDTWFAATGQRQDSMTTARLRVDRQFGERWALAGLYTRRPGSDIHLLGGAARYTLLQAVPDKVLPAWSLRGGYSRLGGSQDLALDNSHLELLAAWRVGAWRPLAGLGLVHTRSRYTGPVPTLGTGPESEQLTQWRRFLGIAFLGDRLEGMIEFERLGQHKVLSARLNLRF